MSINYTHRGRSYKCPKTPAIKAKPQRPRLRRKGTSPGKSDSPPVGSRPRKIRIVLERFGREVSVSDLWRREGIEPGVFYAWTKKVMKVREGCLTRDTARDATRHKIGYLMREN